MNLTPYQIGWQDYYAGMPITDNPYWEDQVSAAEWSRGWYAAEADEKAKHV